jgi:hypothetical protein
VEASSRRWRSVDVRHAHGALSMQINKTDANDAHGIAQMMRAARASLVAPYPLPLGEE